MGSTSRAVQNALEAVLAERLKHCDQVSQNERVDEESKLAQMLEQVPQSTGSRSTAPATRRPKRNVEQCNEDLPFQALNDQERALDLLGLCPSLETREPTWNPQYIFKDRLNMCSLVLQRTAQILCLDY